MTRDEHQTLGYARTLLAEYQETKLWREKPYAEARVDVEREVIQAAGWKPTGRRGWYTNGKVELPHGEAFSAAEHELDAADYEAWWDVVRKGTVRVRETTR